MSVPVMQAGLPMVVWILKREVRAIGGCLGIHRRRRTWHAAISCGEVRAPFDPQISEWGNPPLRSSNSFPVSTGGAIGGSFKGIMS